MSLAEFLAMPETKPYKELIDGEIVEKTMPGSMHGGTVGEMLIELGLFLRTQPIARMETEVRHADVDHEWVFLPDISVTKRDRRPPRGEESGPIEVMPDLAIEVLSPDDRPGRVARRIEYYLRSGVTLIWIVDPEDESVAVFERGAASRDVRSPDKLSGAPVLPGFELDLGDLFARVKA